MSDTPYMGFLEDVYAKNLRRLMSHHSLKTNDAVQKKSGVGRSTIDRMRKSESSARLENLASVAKAFSLEPWQILVPDIDPQKPPTLGTWPFDIDYEVFDRLDDIQKAKIEGAILHLIGEFEKNAERPQQAVAEQSRGRKDHVPLRVSNSK